MPIQVPSSELWIDTSIDVKSGDTLNFSAKGIWVDFYIPCTADGYAAHLFYKLNKPPRIPDDDRYFRLMGRIVSSGVQPTTDEPEQTFAIGSESSIRASDSGRLFVFCNDRRGHYGNNWGSVILNVENKSEAGDH